MPISEIYNCDCVEYMKSMPDKYFDLAIVDPPYGIGRDWKKSRKSRFYHHESSYRNESTPGSEYFSELFRVSKNQIIWGANYYTDFLPARNSWIVWDKQIDYPTQHLSEGELAWTSFNIPVRIVSLIWNGCCRCEKRAGFHPHEKPKSLYKWLFDNYFVGGVGYWILTLEAAPVGLLPTRWALTSMDARLTRTTTMPNKNASRRNAFTFTPTQYRAA